MKTSEALRATKALIDSPEKWHQGWLSHQGRLCTIGAAKTALGLDLRGRLHAQVAETTLGPVLGALGRVVDEVPTRLAWWNDTHSHAEVMAAFDCAIADAEAQEAEHDLKIRRVREFLGVPQSDPEFYDHYAAGGVR